LIVCFFVIKNKEEEATAASRKQLLSVITEKIASPAEKAASQ
jgi:hypothetical protein